MLFSTTYTNILSRSAYGSYFFFGGGGMTLSLSISHFILPQHFQKTMPEKYADDFEVVVEEADRIKINIKKMKR